MFSVSKSGTIYVPTHEVPTGALPIIKMAYWLRWLSREGYTQICVARGRVSWWSKDNDEAGELQLWYREKDNHYYLYASNTAGDDMVCKVIDVFTLSLPKVH